MVCLLAGEIIPDGTDFRNTAHFRYKAQIFVPCGGRPEAINVSNVKNLFDEEGNCNFKYIVEGANLFITQQARLYLEKRGVILFKDSSANKGGVTSSSLEVGLHCLGFASGGFNVDCLTVHDRSLRVSDYKTRSSSSS